MKDYKEFKELKVCRVRKAYKVLRDCRERKAHKEFRVCKERREHKAFKGYIDLATADLKTTRMNAKLNSLIDHILVSKFARADVSQERATVFKPGGGDGNPDLFPGWRQTFSDHFPLSFEMKVGADTDVDFFR